MPQVPQQRGSPPASRPGLQSGLGVPQDDAEAMKWFRLAAEQGDVYTQHKLDADAQLQTGN